MAIINYQVGSIGETGQIPRFVYLNTTDSLSVVTEVGYLNGLVGLGIEFSDTDMALVVTRSTPNAIPVSDLFDVVYSAGDWSLVSNTGSINDGLNIGTGVGVFASRSGSNLTFNSLIAGTGVTISAASGGNITISAPASGGTVTSGSSEGTGSPIFDSGTSTSSNLSFRSLAVGSGLTISTSSGTITISSTSAGGTVTGGLNEGIGSNIFDSSTSTSTTLHFKGILPGGGITVTNGSDDVTISTNISSIGTGIPIYAGLVGTQMQFISVLAGTNMTSNLSAGTLTFNCTAITEGSSEGSGSPVFDAGSSTSSALFFRSLIGGSGISLSTSSGAITITATGGGGSVTSITQSTGITCTPNPITGTGTIGITATGVTAGPYTYTALTVNAQGQLTAASNGAIGSTTQVLYNSSGVITGSANMTFNGSVLTLGNTSIQSNSVLNSGADLEIGTSSGNDISFFTNGSLHAVLDTVGDLTLYGALVVKSGNGIQLQGTSSGSVVINVPGSGGTNYVFKLPAVAGTTGQVLYTTDGLGTLGWTTASTGTITGGTNLGTGTGIFSSASGGILQFNSIAAGTGISIALASNTITITNTGGGGGGVSTLTGDSGGAISPSSGNINIKGLGDLYNVVGSGSTLTITPTAGAFPITPYVVGAVGEAGYQTIQSAINACNTAGGGSVYVQDGTYTENLTLYAGIDLVGTAQTRYSNNTVIIGVHTAPTGSGTLNITNIYFTTTSYVISSFSAGTCTINLSNCTFNGVTGFALNLPSWTGTISFENCNDTGSSVDGIINNIGGSPIFISNCALGYGSTYAMISTAQIAINNSIIICPINVETGATAQFGTSIFYNIITFSNNSVYLIDNCSILPLQGGFGGIAAIAVNTTGIGTISNCTISSSNNPAISGTGTGVLTFFGNTFLSNTAIASTLTLATGGAYFPAGTLGSAGYIWTSNGAGVAPSFQAPASGGTVTSGSSEGTGSPVFDSGTSTSSNLAFRSLAAGTGISLSTATGTITISSTVVGGVSSVGGTTNQISPTTPATGSVVLSFPTTMIAPGSLEVTTLLKGDAGATLNTNGVALNLATDNDGSTVNIGTGTTGRTINIGTSAAAAIITIGNQTGATSITEYIGTGNFVLNGAGTSTYTFGAATTTGTITIGGTAQTGAMTFGSSSGTNTVNIGTGNGATSVNMGTGTGNNLVTIGSVSGTSGIVQYVGTGNYTLNGVGASTFSFGSSTTSGTITIGGTAQTGTITLGNSSGTNIVDLGTGSGATTINIAASTNSGSVNIGTNTINIGNSTSTYTITLGSGSGSCTANICTASTVDKTANICTGGGTGTIAVNIGSVTVGTNTLFGTTDIQGNLTLALAGNKMFVHASTAASDSAGIATLSGGTKTVSTTAVTASSIIFTTINAVSGTGAPGVLSVPQSSISAGVNFVVNSSISTDNSSFYYWIIN